MLLYSLLHLTGYDVSLDDLKTFRQWGSKCPGHSEFGATPGVEVTTGPLGQGLATSVGMAVAQKHLAAVFNRPDHNVVDYAIYAVVSDGDLMEGISSEAASLAGHWKLGNLICLYDDNHISIEGDTELAFTEDVALRFQAFNWQVITIEDGNDLEAVARAIHAAKAETNKPTLIKVRTHIAWGAPNAQDTAEAHGSPLGEAEIKLTKKAYGWDPDKQFHVPAEALAHFRKALEAGAAAEAEWNKNFADYEKAHPELARQFKARLDGRLPDNWTKGLPKFTAGKGDATRKASAAVLNAIAAQLPQ
jgi:transketolase